MPIQHINRSLTTRAPRNNDTWLPKYPNPPDFRFDYFKLLDKAPSGLADLPTISARKKVAIVGAGCAGMCAARELYRCGLDITIYEASDRIGGRLYTKKNPSDASQTGMEMGAMRMPFFNMPENKNCILAYYLFGEQEPDRQAMHAQFPNPGSVDPSAYTGIYLNDGRGTNVNQDQIEMIRWENNKDPQNTDIALIGKQVNEFVGYFEHQISPIYVKETNDWDKLWDKIVAHYGNMTFDDLVMEPMVKTDCIKTGNFGGFGLNTEQARLLYTIGTGDGSWGAFYSVSALWFIRCTMFGFGGKDLQTIIGLSNADKLPFYNERVEDSLGYTIPSPTYKGIQSLVEYLYFCRAPNSAQSLHESDSVRLFLNSPVQSIENISEKNQIAVTTTQVGTEAYDHVFITSTQWASQMSFRLENFTPKQIPPSKIVAEHTQHNIASCKLFFPLKEKYWVKPGNTIPQVIVTDTFLQDCYALSWDTSDADNGVILASYTWEDDALKVLPFDKDDLSKKVLGELKRITKQTLNTDITEYIDMTKPVMLQWITQPSYIGCSKLYRQRDESLNEIDLSYNQDYSEHSNLYFVGENYSVEGGWTEPALRSALDGVIHLLNNLGATFKVDGFDFNRDYPKRGKIEEGEDQKCRCIIS